MITSLMRRIDLQAIDAGKLENDVFKFTAKSISNNELCEAMMKIALSQVNNLPLLFRHRHPAGNDEKAVPIFGRSAGGRIQNEGDLKYLVIDYEIPLKAPNGHELLDKQLFADWVKASAEGGNPIGISLAFIQHLEDGKAYWVDVYEASGTHVPACIKCRHVTEYKKNEQGEEYLPDEVKDKQDEKKKYELLEKQLEKLTKEKGDLEGKLVEAEGASTKALEDMKVAKTENAKFTADLGRLTLDHQALKDRLDYAETKKPLVDRILKEEKRAELEDFYKKQTLEYLQKEVLKWESLGIAANIATPKDSAGAMIVDMQKRRLDVNQKVDVKKALEQVAPDLRPKMLEFYKSMGIDTTEATK